MNMILDTKHGGFDMTQLEQTKKIFDDEEFYEKVLKFNAMEICENSNCKFVLIAGPSCAGKTTTAKKLKHNLRGLGKTVYSISLDDFYLPRECCPKDDEGNIDFESIYALNLQEIHKVFQSLQNELKTVLPVFDFKNHCPSDKTFTILPTNQDIYIVEGLHALNPLIYSDSTNLDSIYRIYLDSFRESGEKRYESRMLRRIVRDYFHRGASAEKTFEMWASVVAGEDKYIRPFAKLAEGTVNTFFDYEIEVLKPFAITILEEVADDNQFFKIANEIVKNLQNVGQISPFAVPEKSLLQEFLPPQNLWR